MFPIVVYRRTVGDSMHGLSSLNVNTSLCFLFQAFLLSPIPLTLREICTADEISVIIAGILQTRNPGSAGAGQEDGGGVPQAGHIGRDVLQVAPGVWRHGGEPGEEAEAAGSGEYA